MAYTTRSLESVRRLGPESSRLLRDAEDLKDRGFTSAANQVASQAAQIKRSESPVDTPALRNSREAAQRAISMGQQMAIQGDFDPAAVVAPLKQQFLGGISGLPHHQQTALLNRFEPQFRQQRILNQQEQKSFLQLKESQRQARLKQAQDAIKAPVAARIEELMASGDKPKVKQSNLDSLVFQNPDALRNPEILAMFNTANSRISKTLEAKEKAASNLLNRKFSLTQQALASGKGGLISKLWDKKTKDLVPISQEIAEGYGTKEARGLRSKEFKDVLSVVDKNPSPKARVGMLTALTPANENEVAQIELRKANALSELQTKTSKVDPSNLIKGVVEVLQNAYKANDDQDGPLSQDIKDEMVELGILLEDEISSKMTILSTINLLLIKQLRLGKSEEAIPDSTNLFDG